MIDKTRLPRHSGQLPAFTPVPRQTQRHDGWTPERQQGFIEALADTGSVKAAAHAVNMTPEGAYLLRRHPQAQTFRKAWEAALSLGVQRLEDLAMERALHGVDVPVYSYGKLIGKRTIYNDRLLMFLLRNRAPTRFAADGRVTARQNTIGNPQDANRLSQLKKQWRKEWEEEQEKGRPSVADIRASIDRKVAEMRGRVEASLSPQAKALYEAARQAQEEDAARGWKLEYRSGDGEDAA